MDRLAPSSVQINVPGKIMITGEYDVLYQGGESLAFTTDKYLSVKISLSLDKYYHLSSNIWKQKFSSLFSVKTYEISRNIYKRSVYNLIRKFKIPPVEINVNSQLDPKVGMGSSSALLLGLTFAFYIWTNKNKANISWSKELINSLAQEAYNLQKSHQSMASGYDIISQLSGGLIRYQQNLNPWPGLIHKHSLNEQRFKRMIHLYKGGKGAPTKIVLPQTHQWLKTKQKLKHLQDISKDLVLILLDLLSPKTLLPEDKRTLFEKIGEHRKIFENSPHFPRKILTKLSSLKSLDKTWSFKTTGAGGEDSLLLCGEAQEIKEASKLLKEINWEAYDYEISQKGLHYFIFDAEGNKSAHSILSS